MNLVVVSIAVLLAGIDLLLQHADILKLKKRIEKLEKHEK